MSIRLNSDQPRRRKKKRRSSGASSMRDIATTEIMEERTAIYGWEQVLGLQSFFIAFPFYLDEDEHLLANNRNRVAEKGCRSELLDRETRRS